MTARPVVDVAVGVLIRPDGRFLLASRPEGKPYAHYWEFPGGKLEPGETVAAALARELHEELGVDIAAANPWVVREFEYPHVHVRLHFCRVTNWRGEPHAREGQVFRFCALDDLPAGPLLPATVPVLRWLDLAPLYAITDASQLGTTQFLHRLEHQLQQGLRLVLFREPDLANSGAEPLFHETLAHVRSAGGRLLVSSRHPWQWAFAADGVHLTSRDLAACTRRPDVPWVCASSARFGATGACRRAGPGLHRARSGARDRFASRRARHWLARLRGDRGAHIGTGLCDRRPESKGSRASAIDRCARHRGTACGVGRRLTGRFRFGVGLADFGRIAVNGVSIRGPGAEVDQFAAFGTERPVSVLRRPGHGCAAGGAGDRGERVRRHRARDRTGCRDRLSVA